MRHYNYKSIPGVKFEADSSSKFWRYDVTKFPLEEGNESSNSSIYPRKTGLTLKKEFLYLLDPKLTPHVNFSKFQAEEIFSFSKFLGRLDEKRAAATPLIDQFCKNLVRTCLKDKN